MDKQNTARTTVKQQDPEFEQELLHRFLERHRPIPRRPAYSRTSTIIIRKELVPFYFAIYDHDLSRFIELQYRVGKGSPLHSIRIPETMQPPATDQAGI